MLRERVSRIGALPTQPGTHPMTSDYPRPPHADSSTPNGDNGQKNHWHIKPSPTDQPAPKTFFAESPDGKAASGDGQSPPAPKSPLESNYLEQPIGATPNWDFPKTKDDAILMVNQMHAFMNYANIKNPNIKCLLDLMDYHESLEIELHKIKLEKSARLEFDLTQNQFDGFIANGQKIKEDHEPLLDGLWPRQGLCLMFAPPSFGKTLVTFELMKRLELPGESILYCGADEDEEGIGKKLKSIGYENWPFDRLPDGQTNNLAWENIERWQEYSREHKRRFLILDLLMDYAPMEINNPGSIVNALSPVLAFAHRHSVVVLGLCHTSKNSPNAPTGHQSLWGKCNRLLQLRETQDSNTVELVATRRGPKKSVLITHDWIDTVEAKRVFSGQDSNSGSSYGPKKKTKLEQAVDWIKEHSEYTGISCRLLADTAKHHHEDPLDISKNVWMEALKQTKETNLVHQ